MDFNTQVRFKDALHLQKQAIRDQAIVFDRNKPPPQGENILLDLFRRRRNRLDTRNRPKQLVVCRDNILDLRAILGLLQQQGINQNIRIGDRLDRPLELRKMAIGLI